MSETFEKISKVLDGDGVVPRAGVEAETLAWLVDDGTRHKSAFVNDPTGWAHGYKVAELVDRSYANRLEAENAALQQRLNVADQAIDELKNVATVPPAAFDEEAERALFESQYVREQQRGDSGRYMDPVVQHRFDGWIMCAKQRAGVV